MPRFTVETSYRLPVYRQQTYEAATIEQACRLAIEDDDWPDEKRDYESAGETYVSGIWAGADTPYRGAAVSIPSEFAEMIQHKADRFETLIGVLKVLAHVEDLQAPDLPYWLSRAHSVIAKAEAILAGAPDPDAAASKQHVLLRLDENSVRTEIGVLIESDETLTTLSPDAVSDADIRTACLAVVDCIDLSEQLGAARFRAAITAIHEAERRLNRPA